MKLAGVKSEADLAAYKRFYWCTVKNFFSIVFAFLFFFCFLYSLGACLMKSFENSGWWILLFVRRHHRLLGEIRFLVRSCSLQVDPVAYRHFSVLAP